MSPDISKNTDSTSAVPRTRLTELEIEALSPRQQRVILVCDVVESVRWMEHDEDNAISRWSQFASLVRASLAPEHVGSVVKSTGDGLMLEFEAAPQAVAAAHALQQLAQKGNEGQAPERQMHLRIGIHQAQARRDAHDLYGHGVNLAARVANLAGPGEIIVTPEVRDHITDSLDGRIEDLGECYLKHLSEPQRVYRVGEVGKSNVSQLRGHDTEEQFKPTLAVVPFLFHESQRDQKALGDLIADGLIARLVRSQTLRVLSRFSTATLSDHGVDTINLKQLLNADYVVRGSFWVSGNRLSIGFEISRTADENVLTADRINGSIEDLFDVDSESCNKIASITIQSVIDEQLKSSLYQPLPTLTSYSLYLMGVAGIHRSMPKDNAAGETALLHLIDRHPRAAEPRVWLAQWLAIKANRGLVTDVSKVYKQAHDLVEHALQLQPSHSFALAVSGLLDSFFQNDFETSAKKYEQAIAINPNDGLAWLYRSTMLAWTDRGADGVVAAETALALAPLHPMRYYIESLAALPFLVAGDHDRAEKLASSSIRANRTHTASYRVLAAAQVFQGRISQAQETISKLYELEPNASVASFFTRYPGRHSCFRLQYEHALRVAGFR